MDIDRKVMRRYLRALEDALDADSKIVRYGKRRIEYRTIREMLALWVTMRRELGLDTEGVQIEPEIPWAKR